MRIVVLSGKQGSGKTTTQKLLQIEAQKGEWRAITLNFADVLYEMHDAVLAILAKYGIKRDIAKDGVLLQLLGTDWGRKTLGEDIWIKLLLNKISILAAQNSHYSKLLFIVGDCRFENEFKAFAEALRVRLECPTEDRKVRCSYWRDNTAHPSEVDLDQIAQNGEFDIYLDTSTVSPEAGVETLLQVLNADQWVDNRKIENE